MLFNYSHQNLFNIKKHHALYFVHVLFCVFQTKLNKAVNIFFALPKWIRNIPMIQCFSSIDENFAWLTKKTEEPKSNKGNFTFPIHRVM